MKKFLAHLAISIIASMITAILFATVFKGKQPTLSNIWAIFSHSQTIELHIYLVLTFLLIFFFLVIFTIPYFRNTAVDIKYKNDEALLVNTELLSSISKQDTPVIIKSTRCSAWTLQHSKSTSQSFRKILTNISADEKHEIQRLWIVRNSNDYKRLIDITNKYKNQFSTSIKYIYLEDCPNLIEVFIIGDTVATIGIPTGRHGATIGLSIKVKNKEIIKALHSYFDILYGGGKFALERGEVKIEEKIRNDI